MPKWGLTQDQLSCRPWGLDPKWLAPAKTVTDPIHHDIYLTVLEQAIVDSDAMQRLRRVRQLGTTSLIYPSATHNRFAHALGTMRAAQDLLDAVIGNRSGPHHTVDLLDEWAGEPPLPSGHRMLDVKLAEATVLARLGALLHDLCHVPMGHTIEDDLHVLEPHDGNFRRFERLWPLLGPVAPVIDAAASRVPGQPNPLKAELRMLILSKEENCNPATDSAYPFVADIVGNTICADLIDYLQRDHYFTGLPIALGNRFMNDFYVKGSGHIHYPARMVVRVSRDGHARTDVITELVKYLRYRYELTERVLYHHAKLSADAMIGKLLELWRDSEWVSAAAHYYPKETASVGHDDMPRLRSVIIASEDGEAGAALVDAAVHDRLEEEFTARSDDGLLEYLEGRGNDGGADSRHQAIAQLASAVANRRLYKLIGRADSKADRAVAEEKYQKFGRAADRKRLETAAARRADLEHGWQVVIWLPNPAMRLKVADVLVDTGDSIAKLARVEPAGGDIVEQHRQLWSITVYAHASVRDPGDMKIARVLLSSLKTDMDIDLISWDGQPVKTLVELAADVVSAHAKASPEVTQELVRLAPSGSGDITFKTFVHQLWRVAEANGLVTGPPPDDLW